MPKTTINVQALRSAFTIANNAALLAAPGDDGGTCNFDTCTLSLPHSRRAEVEEAAAGTGIRARAEKWIGECFFLSSSAELADPRRLRLEARRAGAARAAVPDAGPAEALRDHPEPAAQGDPMTWHNIPCPATLPAVSQACPDGWLEVLVEYVSARSMPGGGDPVEADVSFHLARVWGLDCDAFNDIKHMLVDLYQQDGGFDHIPHGATALFKVVRGSVVVTRFGDFDVPSVPTFTLTAHWGADGEPVYTLDEHPSLTGQQQAPQPGRGDMWASVIERYDGQIYSALVDIFKARREQGLAKYNTPLQAGNGRDICKDLADETLDRIVYAEQAAQERPEFADIMRGMQERDIATLGGLLGLYGRMTAQLGPDEPKIPHPIDDRPQVGTAEARVAALALCAAAELMRRSKKHAAAHPCGDIAMQVSLAENPTDLALIGKMAGRAGAAMFAVLGIGPGGERLPGGPVR